MGRRSGGWRGGGVLKFGHGFGVQRGELFVFFFFTFLSKKRITSIGRQGGQVYRKFNY